MKPIDAITELPRSTEVARLMTTQLRHGEIQSQVQTTLSPGRCRVDRTLLGRLPGRNTAVLTPKAAAARAAHSDIALAERTKETERRMKPRRFIRKRVRSWTYEARRRKKCDILPEVSRLLTLQEAPLVLLLGVTEAYECGGGKTVEVLLCL